MTNRSEWKINEEFLSATFFKKCTKENKEKNIGGKDICHDAKYSITFVKDRSTESRKGVSCMGDQIRHVISVYSIRKHHNTNDNKDVANYTPG